MRNHLTLLLALMTLAILPMTLGTAGCPPKPDDPTPPPVTHDYDEDVKDAAEVLQIAGDFLLQNPKDFDTCIAGTVCKATGDATLAVVLPVKEAVEGGTCTGTTASFVIDPSPCVGLPGTPDSPEAIEASKEEVGEVLGIALPVAGYGLGKAADAAKADGEAGACTALSLLRDLLAPAGELAGSILTIIETPGEPFTFPGASWDCSACQEDAGDGGDDDDSGH